MLSVYRSGEIDLFENLDIVHIRLLVDPNPSSVAVDLGWASWRARALCLTKVNGAFGD